MYVVNNLPKPWLGRPTIEALELLIRVRVIEEHKSPFPELFNGLGKMEGDYPIKLKEGAVPFGLTTPRRVAIPLMSLVSHCTFKAYTACISDCALWIEVSVGASLYTHNVRYSCLPACSVWMFSPHDALHRTSYNRDSPNSYSCERHE